jgi:transposase
MGIEGMGRCLAVEGSTTAAIFEAYIERVLAPNLRSGQVVVMDNLAAHESQRIKQLIEERGYELVYLTPYSPDLNPIEEAFSKVKRLFGETEARTRKGLIEAMGVAISAITTQGAQGFFEHCGYRIPVQPL